MKLMKATGQAPHEKAAYSLSDLLIDYLDQLGIDRIFGVPGSSVESLFDAIDHHQANGGRVRLIAAKHEAGAAYMADGYARETGKIGVCVATSGPGATNLLTAVATAYGNGVPMLVITGQPELASFGKRALQESGCTGVDLVSIFRSCTRYNTLVSHPQQFEWKLVAALQYAVRSVPGPVHLSVPTDVWNAPGAKGGPSYALATLLQPRSVVDELAVAILADMHRQARKTVVLIGGGAGKSVGVVLDFIRQTGVEFVTTPDGKGLIRPHEQREYRGVFGFGGHASAEAALDAPEVDLILAVGTDMGEWNTAGWHPSLLNGRLVHIDANEDHLTRSPMARLRVHGEIGATFKLLIDLLKVPGAPDVLKRQFSPAVVPNSVEASTSASTPLCPQLVMIELGCMCPGDTAFIVDEGKCVAWAAHYLAPQGKHLHDSRHLPRQSWLRITTHFAPRAWAVGAAIGTAAANPRAPVVCITSDGSLLMSGQELSVAAAEKLCVVFVVMNDRNLDATGADRDADQEYAPLSPAMDFAAMARAQGGQAFTIRCVEQLRALDMRAICNYPGPTLLDVCIDPNAVVPMTSHPRLAISVD